MIPMLISLTATPWKSPVLEPGRYMLQADVAIHLDAEFDDDPAPMFFRPVNMPTGTRIPAGHQFLIDTDGDARLTVRAESEPGEAILSRLEPGAA